MQDSEITHLKKKQQVNHLSHCNKKKVSPYLATDINNQEY